ncbi:MAG: STAS/SEC14 domain-containing protein [Anaerolineae bacterium]|nr:STAS/SEC14 domain-containing protein [Anaerolineae bacterium]
MPYEIKWLDEPHIIATTVQGSLNSTELRALLAEEIAFAAQSPLPDVYVLRDMGQVETITADVGALRDLAAQLNESKVAFVALVKPNLLVRYLTELVRLLAPIRMRTFDDRATAETFLRDLMAGARMVAPEAEDEF